MRLAVAGLVLLVAGCGPAEKSSLHAMIEADQMSGVVTVACTESSSGTCYALLVTGDNVERLSAAAGSNAGATGITADTRYCIDTVEPADGCALKPLAQGQQIVRRQKAH